MCRFNVIGYRTEPQQHYLSKSFTHLLPCLSLVSVSRLSLIPFILSTIPYFGLPFTRNDCIPLCYLHFDIPFHVRSLLAMLIIHKSCLMVFATNGVHFACRSSHIVSLHFSSKVSADGSRPSRVFNGH